MARETVQGRVAETPGLRRLGRRRAGADDEVVFSKPGDDASRVIGPVLAVAVDASDAALYCSAVALVIGMPDDQRSGGLGVCAGIVLRSIVDDDDLAPG